MKRKSLREIVVIFLFFIWKSSWKVLEMSDFLIYLRQYKRIACRLEGLIHSFIIHWKSISYKCFRKGMKFWIFLQFFKICNVLKIRLLWMDGLRLIIASSSHHRFHRTWLLRGSEQILPPPAVFQVLYCVKISKYSRFPNFSSMLFSLRFICFSRIFFLHLYKQKQREYGKTLQSTLRA